MRNISLLIKPASGNCNMNCRYCFYEDEMNCRTCQNFGMMSFETLEILVKKAIEEAEESCSFLFQGGEPTLAGLPFYEKLIELVEKYNHRKIAVHYGIQTNGYKIGKEWAEFFVKNKFLVGVSLDGTEETHNHYRVAKNGEKTFEAVKNTIELFKEYKVDFNILTVVTEDTVSNVNRIYNFYKREKLVFQQYIECLDPLEGRSGSESYALTPERYGQFLIALLKKWYRDIEKGEYVHIRYFENLIMILRGMQPESCNMRGCCTKQWVIEADGSVYPCDFYALDEWKLGNIRTDDFQTMNAKENGEFFVESSKQIPEECRSCCWFGLCRNGCRRSCEYVRGERQKNYFCKAYKDFFEYAFPILSEINERLR